MKAVILDTHAWIWSLTAAHRLTDAARTATATAHAVHVSPISRLEVAQKVRTGKWPEVRPRLAALAADGQTRTAPFSRSFPLGGPSGGIDGPGASGSVRSHHRGDGGRTPVPGDLEGRGISTASTGGTGGRAGWIWSNPADLS